MTTLPDAGSVLVRSGGPPAVPDAAFVDVAPGPATVCDGDRVIAGVRVRHEDTVRRFDTSTLPAIEDAVGRPLESGSADVVRFGDLAAWRGPLPAASVDALRRRVVAATAGTSATLLAWSAESPRAVDRLEYDVVVGGED